MDLPSEGKLLLCVSVCPVSPLTPLNHVCVCVCVCVWEEGTNTKCENPQKKESKPSMMVLGIVGVMFAMFVWWLVK